MSESVCEEWMLSFLADTDDLFFQSKFRQKTVYTVDPGAAVQHFVWFDNERYAKLARTIAGDAGAWDLKLQHRTVKTEATDWEDVP